MTKKREMASELSEDQVAVLANKLCGTASNVYSLVRAMFAGVEVGDEVFEDLEAWGLFKCEQCNVWQLVNEERDPDFVDTCRDCANAMAGD